MTDKDDMFVCGKHQLPLMYRGEVCPWCDFISSVKIELASEYKRGFSDGVAAMEREAKGEKPGGAGLKVQV